MTHKHALLRRRHRACAGRRFARRPAGRRPIAGRGRSVSVQERRRADQRHDDGVGCERPLRVGSAQGRLRGLRRRPAGRNHALQRRAGARQPGDRARHQRQHGRRQDAATRRARCDRFLFDLLDKEDEIFLYRFSNFPVLLQGWTTDRQRLSRVLDRHHGQRRHGDVRRGGGSGAAGAGRASSARRRSW